MGTPWSYITWLFGYDNQVSEDSLENNDNNINNQQPESISKGKENLKYTDDINIFKESLKKELDIVIANKKLKNVNDMNISEENIEEEGNIIISNNDLEDDDILNSPLLESILKKKEGLKHVDNINIFRDPLKEELNKAISNLKSVDNELDKQEDYSKDHENFIYELNVMKSKLKNRSNSV